MHFGFNPDDEKLNNSIHELLGDILSGSNNQNPDYSGGMLGAAQNALQEQQQDGNNTQQWLSSALKGLGLAQQMYGNANAQPLPGLVQQMFGGDGGAAKIRRMQQLGMQQAQRDLQRDEALKQKSRQGTMLLAKMLIGG